MFYILSEEGYEELGEIALVKVNGGACTGFSGGSCTSSGGGSGGGGGGGNTPSNSGTCTAIAPPAAGGCTAIQSPNNSPEEQVASNPNDYHCDIKAWNKALELGLDPRSDTGESLDFNGITVDGIYSHYDSNVSDHPQDGTSGFAFVDRDGNGSYDHMFTYESNSNGTYTAYDSDGIAPLQTYTWTVGGTVDANSVFVALDSL